MANKKVILETEGGVALVGGLEWQLLPSNKPVETAVRDKAKIKSATHFVSCKALTAEEIETKKKNKSVHRVAAGMTQSVGGKGDFGKKPHSVAAVFAEWSKEFPKAAMYGNLPDERISVVVVINGMPVFDAIILERTEARERLATFLSDHPDMQVFANDAEQYPQDYYEDLWVQLITKTNPKTALKSIPVDYIKLAGLAVLVVALYGGWTYWNAEQKKAAQRALEAQAAAMNPETLYTSAISAVTSFGIERGSILRSLNDVQQLPAVVDGWETKEIGCTEQGCTMLMNRVHGTFERLTNGIKGMPISIVPDPSKIDLQSVNLVWTQEMKPAPQPSVSELSTEKFLATDGSQFQEWMLAGLSLRIDAASLFPDVAGVPPDFKHPLVIKRGTFEVSGISLPIAKEIVRDAPANIVFNGYKMTLDVNGSDPLTKSIITLTGNYYVNQ